MFKQLITLACLFAPLAYGYPKFISLIPNGDAGSRAGSGITCAVLGHSGCVPGAARNKFGLDFKAAGLKWTKALCRKDSDGDGLTNGQELGDPCCKWTPTNGYKLRQTKLSHPGEASEKNTAPKNCPTPNPSPSKLPPKATTKPPPPSGSKCGAGFSAMRQPDCDSVVFGGSKKRGKYTRSVSVVINNLRFVTKVSVTGKPLVDIKKVVITVNGMTTQRLSKKKVNSITVRSNDLVSTIPTAPRKKTCCGRPNGLPITTTIRYCLRTNSKACFNATFSGKTNIKCVNACKGKKGRVLVMNASRKCAICK